MSSRTLLDEVFRGVVGAEFSASCVDCWFIAALRQ